MSRPRAVVIACVAYVALVLALLPFVSRPLPALPQITGIYATAVLVADLCTYVLLAAQFRASGDRALLVLAGAYLYSGIMAMLHLLTFPGAVIPEIPLIGYAQTVSWLYVAWSVGFVAWLFAGVMMAGQADAADVPPGRTRRALVTLTAAVLALAALLTVVATLGITFLPSLISGDRFSGWSIGFNALRGVLALIALGVLWSTQRRGNVILLWLSLTLLASAAGPLLTDFGGRRYTFGWYAGRASFVLASFVLLAALLHEFVKLQKALADTNRALVARTESLHGEIGRREAAERTLVQTEKMEAVGRLAGGVAHDFNNLLTAVVGNLEVIKHIATDERIRQRAEAARQGALRGGRLTRSLLAFGRRQPLQPELVRPGEAIRRFELVLERALGPAIALSIASPPDVWNCCADAGQLEVALLNLALNARDAMAEGGTLRLDCANATFSSRGEIAAGLELEPGEYVAIGVSDSGAGIPPALLPRVFEPFFTTRELGKGSGLGLSHVQGFARQSGGDVGIASPAGGGTTVTIYLPRATSDT